MSDLPQYYFRIRDNGANVYRVDGANRERRLDLVQIATVNLNNDKIKAQGERQLTPDDLAAIDAWRIRRQTGLPTREMAEAERLVESLNLTAQWVQTRASAEQLEALTDTLLLAMHDLRNVLIRKKAERIDKS